MHREKLADLVGGSEQIAKALFDTWPVAARLVTGEVVVAESVNAQGDWLHFPDARLLQPSVGADLVNGDEFITNYTNHAALSESRGLTVRLEHIVWFYEEQS